MNVEFFEQISQKKNDIIKMLTEWVAIPSVSNQKAADGTPFGKACHDMFEKAIESANELGLTLCKNYDDNVLTVDLCEGKPAFGIICHLDVVDADGQNWTNSPWKATVIDDKIYGRGVSDNKGPGVAALFALAFLKEHGLTNKNIRLYLGTSEETGSPDVLYYQAHYEKKEDMPPVVVPDAGNNITYGEWGVQRMALSAKICPMSQVEILNIHSGESFNTIPGSAVAEVKGIALDEAKALIKEDEKISLSEGKNGNLVISVTGKSCHSAAPQNGINSAMILLEALLALPLDEETQKVFFDIYNLYANKPIAILSPSETRELTFSLTGLFLSDNSLSTWHDTRYDYNITSEELQEQVNEYFKNSSVKASFEMAKPPHLVDKDHPFVNKLAQIYEEHEGVKPWIREIKAATYSSQTDIGVGYGQFPGANAHGVDENIKIDDILKTAKLLAYTAYKFQQ